MGFIEEFGFITSENPLPVTYYIYVYSLEGESPDPVIASEKFNVTPFYDRTFFKMVNLRKDIAVFIFYSIPDGETFAYPSFYIRNLENKQLKNYICNGVLDKIVIKFGERHFNYDCLLSDFIKISDYKLSFASTDLENKMLYISILEVYGACELFMSLYEIQIYELYNIKFFQELKEHLYNQFISLGFNYCNGNNCSEDGDEHYSSFLIIGYPNNTDDYLNINEYLENNPSKTFEDITINFYKYYKIENNIFGYIYDSTRIEKLENFNEISFISSSNNNLEIKSGVLLGENEELKLKFTNNIISFNCTIYFRHVANLTSSFVYESFYNDHISKFEGKESFYNIIFDYQEPTTIITNIQTTNIPELVKSTSINEDIHITHSTNKYEEKITQNMEQTEKNTYEVDKIISYNE